MSGTVLDDVTTIRETATPLRTPQDFDPLVRRIGRARIVLLGEATHGTAEFHRRRAELTQRLLAERGFSFVAVDGDGPEFHRLHCCVAGAPGVPNDPRQVLWGFRQWPAWRWANEEVAEFATWLRTFNTSGGSPCGFHGLDTHRLGDTLNRVLGYVRAHAPGRADAVREAFRCFESPEGRSLPLVPEDCRDEVVRLLTAGPAPERYYRRLVRGGAEAWNARATHLGDTLDRLLGAYGPRSKAVVWVHNTHLGTAADRVTLGRLARERYAGDVVAVGFGTFRGSVLAAGHWGGPARRTTVEPARPDSLEALLHEARPGEDSLHVFGGDVGRPAHYDAFVHCDETTAATPLHHE